LELKLKIIGYSQHRTDSSRHLILWAIGCQELPQRSSMKHRETWKLTYRRLIFSQVQIGLDEKCEVSLAIAYDVETKVYRVL
jgi:hypothetical protein